MSESQATQDQQDQFVQAVYGYAASLVREGYEHQQVIAMLMRKGLDQAAAAQVLNNLYIAQAEAPVSRRESSGRSHGSNDMLIGALWCIGGIVVTVATLVAASGGGTYVVAWGAIVYGAIRFIRGLR